MNKLLAVNDSKNAIDMMLSDGARKIINTIVAAPDTSLPLVRSLAEHPSETGATRGNHATAKQTSQRKDNKPSGEEDDEEVEEEEDKPKKRRTWKKPKDKPKRPLSAYNLFFQHEREKLITKSGDDEDAAAGKGYSLDTGSKGKQTQKRRHRKTHGKIGFADLARTISCKWKEIDAETKERFEREADKEKQRYKIALSKWKEDSKLAASQKLANDDAGSVQSDLKDDEDGTSLARRISLDYSTASNSTAAAAAAANTTSARTEVTEGTQQDSLAALIAALQHRSMNIPPPHLFHYQPQGVDFFPRLVPNVAHLPSLYHNPPMLGHPLNHLFAAAAAHQTLAHHSAAAAAAAAAHQSAAAAAAAGAHQSAMAAAFAKQTAERDRFEGARQVNHLHDLAVYSDLFGKPQLAHGMAGPPNEEALRNLLTRLHRSNGI